MYLTEADRGTENLHVIEEKCVKYWRALQNWTEEYFPRVIFVVPDQQRADAIKYVYCDADSDVRKLFMVSTLEEVSNTERWRSCGEAT
jgi:hypothetical protein